MLAAVPSRATLANMLFEGALDPASSPVPSPGRAGAWPTSAFVPVASDQTKWISVPPLPSLLKLKLDAV